MPGATRDSLASGIAVPGQPRPATDLARFAMPTLRMHIAHEWARRNDYRKNIRRRQSADCSRHAQPTLGTIVAKFPAHSMTVKKRT
jgi:hypothetical protein